MSDNIRVYIKELGGASWTDVSSSCLKANFKIRKGFGSLGSASDVSKLSIEYKADDLASATLFHTTEKQIRVKRNGLEVFEGYTSGDSSVKSTNDINLAWVQISAFPYSRAFDDSLAPASERLEGFKVLDSANPSQSLVHCLVDRIKANLEEPYKSLVNNYGYIIQSDISVLDIANTVLIEEGDSYLDVLCELLSEFGLAYYIDKNIIRIVKPFSETGRIVQNVAINDILINPTLKTKPYKKEKRYNITVARVVTESNQSVYQLRDEGESTPPNEEISVNGYYPEEADMEVDYSTQSESNTKELLFATGLSYEYESKNTNNETVSLIAEKAELGDTSASFRFKNGNDKPAYLNQLKIIADTVYYKDTSLIVSEIASIKDVEDIESRFISTSEQANAMILAYHSQDKAERFACGFSSDRLNIEPNSLVTLGSIPFTILVRYVEENLSNRIVEYSGIAYEVEAVRATSKVKKSSATGSLQYISLALDGFAYTYDADGNLEPADQLIKATVKRFGIADNPTWTIGNTVLDTSATTIEIPASYMTGSVITVSVKVGEFTSSDYIYKLVQGSQGEDATSPLYQWRLSASNVIPPADSVIHNENGSVTSFDGTILAETNTGWLDYIPTPTNELPFIWQRMSVDGGLTWGEPYCLSISTVKTIEIIPSATTYQLSSRGIAENATSIRCTINRSSTAIDPCYWTVYKDGVLDSVSVEGEFIDINIAKGATIRSLRVVANCSGLAREVVLTGIQNASKEAKKLNGIYPVNALPTTFNNDGITPLVAGDYCLALVDGYHIPYVFNGEKWQNAQDANTENIGEVLATTLPEVIASDQTVPSISAIYGFFQNFASNTAFIEFLTVWTLLVEKNKFRCRIGIFDNAPVFEIAYNNATVMRIVPDTGKVFIGRPNESLTGAETGFMYDPATEELSSKNRKIVIDGDGEVYIDGYINATAGNFNGTINANAGYFKGDIETGSFSALMKIGGISHTATTGASAQSQFETLLNAFNALGLEGGVRYQIAINELPDVKTIYFSNNDFSIYTSFYLYSDERMYRIEYDSRANSYTSQISNAFTFTLKFGQGQIFRFKNLPTSSVGLEDGQVWSDNGTLKIV